MDSVNASYRPLRQNSDRHSDDIDVDGRTRHSEPMRWSAERYLCLFLTAILLISNSVFIWRESHERRQHPVVPYWGSNDIITREFHWVTEFSQSENKTETNPYWRGLFPIGDGLVSIEDDWAISENLPASLKLDLAPSKSMYYVAAYHELHCLTVLRSALYHLKEGAELGISFNHANHCLDSLRQSIMCHADDTLLYTHDTSVYGDGQARACRDWDALARWTMNNRIHGETQE